MNRDTLIRQLAEADVYAPDHELPETARTSMVALTEIRRRIDMETKESTRAVNREDRRRPGWIVAVAVAAIVIVVGGAALLLLNRNTGDATPATTPTTPPTTEAPTPTTEPLPESDAATSTSAPSSTTTTVPVLDLEAEAFINEYADLFNSGEPQAAADMVVVAGQWDAPGDTNEEREHNTRVFLQIGSDLGTQITVDDCRTLSSGVTQCRLSRSAAEIEPHYPHPETTLLKVRFAEDGSLAYAGTTAIQSDPWWEPSTAFGEWALANYGTQGGEDNPRQQLFVWPDPATYPTVLEELVTEWRAAVGG